MLEMQNRLQCKPMLGTKLTPDESTTSSQSPMESRSGQRLGIVSSWLSEIDSQRRRNREQVRVLFDIKKLHNRAQNFLRPIGVEQKKMKKYM
jgi:hypothetical protein